MLHDQSRSVLMLSYLKGRGTFKKDGKAAGCMKGWGCKRAEMHEDWDIIITHRRPEAAI